MKKMQGNPPFRQYLPLGMIPPHPSCCSSFSQQINSGVGSKRKIYSWGWIIKKIPTTKTYYQWQSLTTQTQVWEHSCTHAAKSQKRSQTWDHQFGKNNAAFANELQVILNGYSSNVMIKNVKPKNYTVGLVSVTLVNNPTKQNWLY